MSGFASLRNGSDLCNLSLLGCELQTLRGKLGAPCRRMQMLKLYMGPGKTVETWRKYIHCGFLNTDPVQGREAWKGLGEEIHTCTYPVVDCLQDMIWNEDALLVRLIMTVLISLFRSGGDLSLQQENIEFVVHLLF